MRRGGYVLLPLLVLAVAACGAPSGKALDTKVEAAVVAQQGGRQVVQVARIGQRAKPIAERADIAVVLDERQRRDRTALPVNR